MTSLKMIEEFQCPGCACGLNPDECDAFELKNDEGSFWCKGHVPGTIFVGRGHILLGLPKGFTRTGEQQIKPLVRLWNEGNHPVWNHFNVAVWAMVKDGFLFVRTYSPRINWTVTDVVEGGSLTLCPQAINVEPFLEEMD